MTTTITVPMFSVTRDVDAAYEYYTQSDDVELRLAWFEMTRAAHRSDIAQARIDSMLKRHRRHGHAIAVSAMFDQIKTLTTSRPTFNTYSPPNPNGARP